MDLISQLPPDQRTAYEGMTPEQQFQYQTYLASQADQVKQAAAAHPQFQSGDQFNQYADYLKSSDQNFKQMQPWQQQEYLNYVQDHNTPKAGDELASAGKSVLHGAVTALDAGGGTVRSSLAKLLGVGRDGDFSRILNGDAPHSDEILARLGIQGQGKLSDVLPSLYSDRGEGFTLKRGGMLDPTARGAAGLGLDVATDPVSWATLGADSAIGKAAGTGLDALGSIPRGIGNAAGRIAEGATDMAAKGASYVPVLGKPASWALMKAGDLANSASRKVGDVAGHFVSGDPFGAFTADTGETLYKSGLKQADKASAKYGKDPVSDLLLQNGIYGSNRQIADQATGLAQKLDDEVGSRLAQASAQGAQVDLGRATRAAREYVSQLRSNPGMRGTADELEDLLNEYYPQNLPVSEDGVISGTNHIPDNPSVIEATKWKSQLSSLVGSPGFERFKETPLGKDFLKSLAGGLRDEVENAAERAVPGMGGQIHELNDQWGRLLSTAKTMDNEAWKGEMKNYLTSVDPIVAALGYGAGPGGAGASVLAKKAADLSKTTWGRTNLGYFLNQMGNSPAFNPLVNRTLIDQESPNPWKDMQPQGAKK